MAAVEQRHEGAPSMSKVASHISSVTTVGLDIAKHVFQVHAVDAAGRVLSAKAIKRKDVLSFFSALPPCLVGLEACGSAHHWGRELQALGHDVRLMPPAYVKPYVRRQKNDAADAAAICEAVSRPSMRFVAVRSIANQAALMRHKAREMLVGQRTQLLNGLRGHLAEIGIIAAQGPNQARALGEMIADGEILPDMPEVPDCVREALKPLASQIAVLDVAIDALDGEIRALAKADPAAVRLMSIPGVGPLTASAFTASVQDASAFTGPREFAAFLGLAPRQHSSGGKERLGRISKMGNGYLRKLLVVGAHAVLFHRAKHDDPLRAWAKKLIAAKPFKLVAVALANKLARIIFALMTSGSVYDGKDLQGETRSSVPAAA
jgi:transposase